MKIAILSTYDTFGGASISGFRLNVALRKMKLDSKMIVQNKSSKSDSVITISDNWFKQKLSFLRFAFDRLEFWFYETSKEVRFSFSTAKIGVDISKNKHVLNADIIHLFWINFGFLSLNSIMKIGTNKKPIIWNLQDMWAFTGGCHYSGECKNFESTCGNCSSFLKESSPDDLSNKIWRNKKSAFKDLNLIIVSSSNWLANEAKKSSLFKDKPIYVIPTPIDTDVFKPIDYQNISSKFKISANKKYILFGSVKISDPRKGYNYFKSAVKILFKNLKENNSLDEIEILIFGNASSESFQDLPYKCNFLGKLSDVNEIAMAYSAASVFVIPSLEDNLPNTIIESLACGTPVVGFNVGGIPDLIIHQKTGHLAEYKNAADLAKGIDFVLKNSQSGELRTNARKFALENYSEINVVNKYKELYQSLLTSSIN